MDASWGLPALGLAAKQTWFSSARGLTSIFHLRQGSGENEYLAFMSLSSSIYEDVGMITKCSINDKNNS